MTASRSDNPDSTPAVRFSEVWRFGGVIAAVGEVVRELGADLDEATKATEWLDSMKDENALLLHERHIDPKQAGYTGPLSDAAIAALAGMVLNNRNRNREREDKIEIESHRGRWNLLSLVVTAIVSAIIGAFLGMQL